MKKIASYLYYIYFGIIYLLFSVILYVPIYFFVNGKNKYAAAKRIKFFWSKWMSFLIGIKVDAKKESSFDLEKKTHVIL